MSAREDECPDNPVNERLTWAPLIGTGRSIALIAVRPSCECPSFVICRSGAAITCVPEVDLLFACFCSGLSSGTVFAIIGGTTFLTAKI